MEEIGQHKIMAMEPEKRDRVINAAMKEFNKGFKEAHTDAIVREAGISKGLLFHYFGSKESLYEFIFSYSIDIVTKEYFELINFEQRDILERMWQAVLLKVDLSYKYPTMFDFLTTAYKENHSGLSSRVYARILVEAVPKLLSNIDESLFKDGVDPQMAINIIRWTQIGYSNSQLESINSTKLEDFQKEYERFLDEIKGYFDLFRKLFYKEKTT
jgi:AcrR family transcriptional regulator